MKKRDFLAVLAAGGGITFLSSRLYGQYKNNQLSFTDLPALPELLPNRTSDITLDNSQPDTAARIIDVAPENDLEEGFKHTERQVEMPILTRWKRKKSIST